ncbi:hypothetical protein CEXT_507131 [Caerostris extrusa]|uniref:Uncharacterized protein n=1 Tax=Caerostris extrusa TaxID=172846 RepID=A0AAV4US73_CAEEX|nr:hypothetical protein CEXT_507131 [Caerostris extrusa]
MIRPLRPLRKLFFNRNPLRFKTFESIQLQPICGNLVSSLNEGEARKMAITKEPKLPPKFPALLSSKKSDNYKAEFPVSESNQDHVSNSSHNSIPGSIIRPLRSLRKLFFHFGTRFPSKLLNRLRDPIYGNLVSSLNGRGRKGEPEKMAIIKEPKLTPVPRLH